MFHQLIPGKSNLIKGLVFGVMAWLVGVGAMPMSGAGLFGMNIGMMALVMTLDSAATPSVAHA